MQDVLEDDYYSFIHHCKTVGDLDEADSRPIAEPARADSPVEGSPAVEPQLPVPKETLLHLERKAAPVPPADAPKGKGGRVVDLSNALGHGAMEAYKDPVQRLRQPRPLIHVAMPSPDDPAAPAAAALADEGLQAGVRASWRARAAAEAAHNVLLKLREHRLQAARVALGGDPSAIAAKADERANLIGQLFAALLGPAASDSVSALTEVICMGKGRAAASRAVTFAGLLAGRPEEQQAHGFYGALVEAFVHAIESFEQTTRPLPITRNASKGSRAAMQAQEAKPLHWKELAEAVVASLETLSSLEPGDGDQGAHLNAALLHLASLPPAVVAGAQSRGTAGVAVGQALLRLLKTPLSSSVQRVAGDALADHVQLLSASAVAEDDDDD